MMISQPKSNEEISSCVQAAIERLDKVDADAEKEKRQIVRDLAKDLEEKIPTDSICNEIVHQLHGKLSPRTIRNCLDAKYKEKHRVANARKQKRRENTKDLAASVPLEQEKAQQLMIAATQEGKSVTIPSETSSNSEASTKTEDKSEAQTNQMKSVSLNEQTPYAETDNNNGTSLIAIDNLAGDRPGLEKCPNCRELEEALLQATTMSTADTLHSKVNPNEESEIEFPLPYQYVQQYMAAEYRQGKSKVWFNVKINVKTKHVISAKAGRISESEAT